MSKEKSDRKASAGHLALHFESTSKKGESNAVLAYQDGVRTRRFILGVVAPATASSDFGDIPCWGFTPAGGRDVDGPSGNWIGSSKKKTAREVKTAISAAIFGTLVGQRESPPTERSAPRPSRVQGAGTAA